MSKFILLLVALQNNFKTNARRQDNGQIVRLEDVQHRVVCMQVAGWRRCTPRQGDGKESAGALKVEEVRGGCLGRH